MQFTLVRALVASCVLVASISRSDAADGALVDLLREGRVLVLMRHETTEPGVGDPPGFSLGDCSTQRNLDPSGRTAARNAGAYWKSHDIRFDDVRTSAWCRCRDTALEMDVGEPVHWRPLDSIFTAGANARAESVQELHRFVAEWSGRGNALFVTHQVNITAFTGLVPAMGEAILVRLGPTAARRDPRVLGRFHPGRMPLRETPVPATRSNTRTPDG
jgi:broad specificity phosphatase PhoE